MLLYLACSAQPGWRAKLDPSPMQVSTASMSEINDSYGYVLYVDEAGDDGTRIFKPEDPKGSSEWLCLAGYLVRREVDTELPNLLSSIRADIGANQGPALHYRDLSPTKRQRACDLLGSAPARAFVVCSFKRTMQGHSNARAAARSGGTKQYLYNWIVRILLERVTDLCWRDSERRPADQRRVKLVFSHRGGHRYGQMKAYLELLRRQAIGKSTFIDTRQIRPDAISWHLIESVPHYQLAGLQLADILASAAYQACDKTSPNWSCRPALALKPIMAREADLSGVLRITDYGVTLLPAPYRAGLSEDQRKLFEAVGYTFRR